MLPGQKRIAFGADYNPEQWSPEVWAEDVRLMREAGVDLVALGIFSWALLEPRPGEFDFSVHDRVLDLLHEGGVRVDLATSTASPPGWLARLHPETLPVTVDGARLWPGSRQAYCPSSPVFRERAALLVETIATRYAGHPALALWHVGNEYACHVARCWCDVSAEAFRRWLHERYGTLDALNAAWGTAFWSQHVASWDDVLPPRLTPTYPNPAQELDFLRFTSDELLGLYDAERDVLRRITPGVPVTTNFMVMTEVRGADYWRWAPHLDVVSNDHYLTAADPDAHVELALAADVTRGLASGAPWLLMEHSTSAVNWQPRNVAKQPGQMLRNSLQHVARGADGVCFFQWRASQAGAEQWHSAMVPHAGTGTKVWREVVELGRALASLAEVVGSRVVADVAIVVDWQAWWALELDARPSSDVRYADTVLRLFRALWDAGVTVDVVAPTGEVSGYRLVVVPTLYLVTDEAAANLDAYVRGGGHALVTYCGGLVDENQHVRLGGYPGAFRDLLGIVTEEFFPLREGERVHLDDGGTADVWTELTHVTTAEVVARYSDGPVTGAPAVTRARTGAGTAWYVGTRLDAAATARLVDDVLACAGVRGSGAPAGVEVVVRTGADAAYRFVINHTDADVTVSAHGTELLTGRDCAGSVTVAAGGVAVVRKALPA